MLRQEVAPRTALVVILVALYAFVLVALIITSRRATALAGQVALAEQTLAQAMSNKGNDVTALRASLALANERMARLEARVPREMRVDLFDTVTQDAQRSGLIEFRYQRKNEFPETMQAGTYKVHRVAIYARGSQERLIAFLDNLQQSSSQSMLIENVHMSTVGGEWQLNADILVYTTGS